MLGLVTIGQSPRDDVVASMFGTTSPSDFVESGALDALDHEQITALAPHPGEQPLVTRLRDGSEVIIGKKQVLPLMELAVSRLETEGCDTICVLCTGEFPRLGRSALVIYPDRLVSHVVEALLPDGMLGVVMPHEGQRDGMLAKWTTATRTVVTAVASPYSASDQIATEVRRLVEAGAEAIVLDCMGFDRRMLAEARSATSQPVMLSNALVGGVLREVVGVSAGLLDGVQRA
jgi:protein AroM